MRVELVEVGGLVRAVEAPRVHPEMPSAMVHRGIAEALVEGSDT